MELKGRPTQGNRTGFTRRGLTRREGNRVGVTGPGENLPVTLIGGGGLCLLEQSRVIFREEKQLLDSLSSNNRSLRFQRETGSRRADR